MIDTRQPDYSNTPVSPQRPDYEYVLKDSSQGPKVSVITPFHNPGPVFRQTVTSILRQSFQDWEWLVINDGSDAENARILNEEAARDPRIRVINLQNNGGPSIARNTGFRHARAEFVFQIDADDLVEPTTIEKLWWFLQCNPQFSFARSFEVGFGDQHYLWTKGFQLYEGFLEDNLVQTTAMVRRSAHMAIGGYNEDMVHGFEDWDYWLNMADHGFWGYSIPEYLIWYRRRLTGHTAHETKWLNWKNKEETLNAVRAKYSSLISNPARFPKPGLFQPTPYDQVPDEPLAGNTLAKTKHRVLFIVPHLEVGGSDRFTIEAIRQLVCNHGWEASVVTTLQNSQHSWQHEFASLTPDVFCLNNFLPPPDYPRFIRYVAETRSVDAIVITHSMLGYMLTPWLKHHLPGVAIIDYVHIEEEYWRHGGYPLYSVNYGDFIDATGASSRHLMRWMVEHGKKPHSMHICPTPPNRAFWTAAGVDKAAVREKWFLPEGKPVIVYCGRLHEQKRPDLALRVVIELKRRGHDFTILFAGDGPEWNKLNDTIQEEKLERVWLVGGLPSDQLRDLFAVSDILFLPSAMEGISLAIYEAMAMGVVPVGADVGGQSELVTPECGFLIPHGPEEFDRYVGVLEGLLSDPGERKRLSANSIERIDECYPFDKLGADFTSLLENGILKSSRKPLNDPGDRFFKTYLSEITEQVRVSGVADWLWADHVKREAEAARPGDAKDSSGTAADGEALIARGEIHRKLGIYRDLFEFLVSIGQKITAFDRKHPKLSRCLDSIFHTVTFHRYKRRQTRP